MSAPLDLDAIQKRADAATPGPWTAPPHRPAGSSRSYFNTVVAENANICGLHDGGQTRESIDANAQFISHAREDVPALLLALQEAQDALRKYGRHTTHCASMPFNWTPTDGKKKPPPCDCGFDAVLDGMDETTGKAP